MIKGVKFDFGSKVLVLAPLTLGYLEAREEELEAYDGKKPAPVIEAVWASLKRNYPEMQRADVAELVDLGNFREAFEAVMDVSGVKRKAQEAAPGEAAALSTGAAS